MRRFYKKVSIERVGDGFTIHLDDRSIKTPARNRLILPTRKLAKAVAAEWEAQDENIDPQSMPLMGLSEGALDQVISDRERIISRIAAFADSDMLYYRADETQPALAERQVVEWDPLLDWARARYDVSFDLIRGVMHRSQPKQTIVRLTGVVAAQDNFVIAAMLSLAGLTGSLVATLAIVEGRHDPQTLWPLVNLEELWQEEQWGGDDLAIATRGIKLGEFQMATRFLDLSRS